MAGGGTTIQASYATRISSGRAAGGCAGGLPAGLTWSTGLPLVLVTTIGGPLPTTAVMLDGNYLLGGPDNAGEATIAPGPGNALILGIDFASGIGPSACDLLAQMYLEARIAFAPSGSNFAGTVSSLCTDQAGQHPYCWIGSAPERAATTDWMLLRTELLRAGRKRSQARRG